MKAFFGGHIQGACRGDMATVINRRRGESKYGVFIYPVSSDEFFHLTGVADVYSPVERVYIGVSNEAAGKIALYVDAARSGELDFRNVDALIVEPHFLGRYPDKPEGVVPKTFRH